MDPTPNHWGEECSGRCREGNSGGSWLGTIQNSLGDLQSLAVVSLRRKDAQGCTRGKRAFGQRIKDKLVFSSLRGLEMAKSTMKYLGGDTLFKKWSMPLIPWSQLPVMKYNDYPKLQRWFFWRHMSSGGFYLLALALLLTTADIWPVRLQDIARQQRLQHVAASTLWMRKWCRRKARLSEVLTWQLMKGLIWIYPPRKNGR